MSDRDSAPRIVRTRCISHIIHLLYRWAKETPTSPESDGFDNVRLARSIISWWESELSNNEPVEQDQFIRGDIPHLEDHNHVRPALSSI